MMNHTEPNRARMPGTYRMLPAALLLTAGLIAGSLQGLQAQDRLSTHPEERGLPIDTTISQTGEVTVKGEDIPYEVTTGTQPVYGDEGEPIATLHFTYYERTDVQDKDDRPLTFSFNGGPGAGSLWMHLGYTSPKKLRIDDEGYPVQPYGVVDNEDSIIDKTDLVYVNPVNTGLSRIIGDTPREEFFGVNEDAEYLADWIDNFISRNGRWNSPKYLKGESYGTTRVAALAGQLRSGHWTHLNGVILVSPTGLGLSTEGPSAMSNVLKLPYKAATAWYHGQLPPELQQQDLYDFLPDVEEFTLEEYLPALTYGGFIDEDRKDEIAEQVAFYSGLSEETVRNHNLAVDDSYFWKDLLRDEGYTIGRLDSRYKGIDRQDAGQRYDYAPEYEHWRHAFQPAINSYLRDDLGLETDLQYYSSGPVRPWNRSGNTAGEDLRQAMAANPYLNVMVQSGYYDGATDYFSAKYTMWNIDPSGKMQDRFRFEGYRSGHMMYLREEDIVTSNEHIREFIEDSLPEEGEPAKY